MILYVAKLRTFGCKEAYAGTNNSEITLSTESACVDVLAFLAYRNAATNRTDDLVRFDIGIGRNSELA